MRTRTGPEPSLSRREALLFETGVKLGGVFHQYLGIPLTARTAPGLARTIERAVGLQPFVAEVRVRINPRAGGRTGRGRYAYHYLTAEMLDVRVRLRDGPVEVRGRLAHRADLRYPLMRVERATPEPLGRRATNVARRGRRPGRSVRRTSRRGG